MHMLCKSTTVHDTSQPTPGLISCTGVTGRWCHTNKGTLQRLHPSQREEGSRPTVTTKLPPWQKIGVTNEIQALHRLPPLSWSSNNITSRHQMSASYYLTAIFNSYIRVTRPFLSLQRVLLARLARILVSESWEGAYLGTLLWGTCLYSQQGSGEGKNIIIRPDSLSPAADTAPVFATSSLWPFSARLEAVETLE